MLMDLNMLVMTGGRERTEADFAALFEQAGFRLTRAIPTKSPFFLLEAKPAVRITRGDAPARHHFRRHR